MTNPRNNLRLLLCAISLFHSGCEKREVKVVANSAPAPALVPNGPQNVRSELIASIRDDMDQLRTSKNPEKADLHRLAQALDQLIQEDTSTSRSHKSSNWSATILTYGSKKSADLATAYLEQAKASQTEATKHFNELAKETTTRIADKMLSANTSADFDASLLEITSLLNQSRASEDLDSIHIQLDLFKQFVTTWQELFLHSKTKQHSQAMQSLDRMRFSATSMSWLNPATISAALQTANKQIGVPSLEEFESTVKSLLERAMTANTPEDLDPLLAEIRKQRSFEEWLPDSARHRTSAAENLIKIIQEGSLAKQSKDSAKLKDFVSRLESQETTDLGIPRSRYLHYIHAVKQSISPSEFKPIIPATSPENAAARMTMLSAITQNLPALRLAVESDRDNSNFGTWFIELSFLQTMATRSEQLLAGHGMQRAVHESSLKMTTVPAIRELQRQFDVLCLHITFAEEAQLPPIANESARDYTARLKNKLAVFGKWESLQTLYTASRAIKIMEPIINKDDDNAVSGFLYGLRLAKEANDSRMATCAFQTVLTNPSKLVPASLVGKHLEGIRKSDPQAYRQGSELALNISKAEGKRAPGERAEALQWVIPARKPWKN